MSVSSIPSGFTSVTPYLIVRQASEAMSFFQRAFGAVETLRLAAPDGSIGHAEMRIGNSMIMLADEYPEMGFVGPETLHGTSVSLMIYVENVDLVFEQAIAAGAQVLRPVTDQFYGDRTGTLQDPFGHWWTIASHKEDLTKEEVKRRFDSLYQ